MRSLKLFTIIFFAIIGLNTATNSLALTDPLTTLEFQNPVHFVAPDGSDLVVKAGTYTSEPAEEWIRLISGARHDAVLIEANKNSHELDLGSTLAMSVPGESEEDVDLHHVMLLLPGGQSLEATGTYSGIRPRGFFKKAFNKVKKRVKRAYKKTRSFSNKSSDQLMKDFLKLNLQDPQNNPTTQSQLHEQASNMRKRALALGRKQATRAHIQKLSAKSRKHLHDIKRKIEKKARQAWSKARHMYRNAKKRAGSAISVTKTPTPSGHAPIPYPNISKPKGKKRPGKSR